MEQVVDISAKLKSKIALSIFGLFTIVYVLATGWWKGDFFIYISASKDLFLGKDIYTQTYVDGYHYYYSVLFAILIYPLSFIPLIAAQYIWLFFNAVLMWRIVIILGRYFRLSALPIREQWMFFVLCCLFSAKLILVNIYYHQVTILILFLTLEGLECILNNKKMKGAFLLALGINIKLLPVVLIPYLLYRKEFKAVLFIILLYGLMLFLPLLVIGIDRNNFLMGQWWSLINPTNNEHVLDVSQRGFHSLTTLLSTLLVDVPPDKYGLQVKRNIANLSIVQLSYVINIVRFAFVALSLYFLRTRPFVSEISKTQRYWEISYIFYSLFLLFSRISKRIRLFSLCRLCGIFFLLLFKGIQRNVKAQSRVNDTTALIISFFTVNATFLLGEFIPFYEHFKTLTYGILLLIPMLAAYTPDMVTSEA